MKKKGNAVEMRVAEVTGGELKDIRVARRPLPEPAAGEVQLRMRAATLNYRDLMTVRRQGGKRTYVPLSCGCGEVTAVGAGVERVRVGDRVAPTFFQNWISGPIPFQDAGLALGGTVEGVAREYACYSHGDVVKIPDSLGDLEAATLPCAALTAWTSLFVCRATRPGDVVLLQGTGGVSVAGLQLAKAAGATVIITSSSDAKLKRAQALGADYGINYKHTPAWGERARELTGGRGVDVVLEVGGMETLAQSLAALREGGDIAGIGFLAGTRIWEAKPAGVKLHRIRVGSRADFEDMLRAIEALRLRPVVDRVFPLEALGEALAAMAAGAFFGKIAIDISR